MKILLLGEFSGFYKNLKAGFRALGHDVTHLASMDGWKKISGADIPIVSRYNGFVGRLHCRVKLLTAIKSLNNYDVVLIVNPNIGLSYISGTVVRMLRGKSEKIFLSACGTDVEYLNYGKGGGFRYWPYDNCIEKAVNISNRVHKHIAGLTDFVIPTFYEYAEPWRNSKYKMKVTKTIPLCIDTQKIKPVYPGENEKLVIFHGLNREWFKGTSYIVSALREIETKYPDQVEIVVKGRMPLDEYLELMTRVDIVVDQCKTYSYGSMNSLYAMSMGKVLMACFQDECLSEYGLEFRPNGIVNIEPNVKYIESKVEYLLQNRESLFKWGEENRKFVEEKHDSKDIAKRYIDLFNRYAN